MLVACRHGLRYDAMALRASLRDADADCATPALRHDALRAALPMRMPPAITTLRQRFDIVTMPPLLPLPPLIAVTPSSPVVRYAAAAAAVA